MTIDDTHEISKKRLFKTLDKSRGWPFTTMLTVANKLGKMVSSRFKHIENHDETKSILTTIKYFRSE